ncbi:bifunctional phosphopantothenoylcysteine decarboxylase/phosphopantothenate--cysteine ligase CoaBC [Clostridioides mangenotii]|uniref:bifunctional phosphopantothenoylcysteine decarboxylase/phosphopantothenate--cysteine ligase CoaBC n=1 Tax=Metaclostridioides mangenotii TaxID=1540 RepID=UPI00214A79F6|nr:bifunctional phosphopantothenoylcysteine decarboxylase/phosphopantothenate--cysteine ligase CoaBC [Clostridioides mangenotii]MCR1953557.1 bifunctional phosphopantothenoylcysteine decarboxylase/phosphopantothenate--cysteine ligase CoaBC [Clostridioides mangenotii]
MLNGKTVVLGVSGGIAVYKACDLVSKLKKIGLNVHVIMTKAAAEFVSPLTFQSLSQNYVVSDMFVEPKTWDVEHISLAKKADLFLIVPATANIIGKIANGISDDMLTTTVMATKAPVLIAPAMNTNMYENVIVQNNIEFLQSLGYNFVEPDSGRLACGDIGAGKLANVDTILDRIVDLLNVEQDLKGQKIVVTAGPTVERIDPVRFLSNRSTGKMGYSIASEAAKRGADVTLISGPTNLKVPTGLSKYVQIESADELYEAMVDNFDENRVFIQSAAVADYRPNEYSDKKIKKSDNDLVINLGRNKDIAYEIGKNKKDKVLVAFAAETNDLIEHAKGKITKKNLDFIVANDLTQKGAGFKADTNIVKIIDKKGSIEEYPKMKKEEVANIILDKVKNIL